MLFNSYEFLLIFLPAAWISYRLAGRINSNLSIVVLLAFSLAFYAWWSVDHLIIFGISIGFNFLIGRLLSERGEHLRDTRRRILAFGVAVNLVALAYFKYAEFIVRNIGNLAGLEPPRVSVDLPMGISFYTFTQIAFLVDVYRREAHEYRLSHYGLFATYFPHLVAGPILHHKEMMPQLATADALRNITSEKISLGFAFFSVGLFKKLVIADPLAKIANPVFDSASAPGFIDAWIAALAYTFHLYFDFSGYSDMAIGISLLFGIWLPINFNSPYKSLSIAEFWRRWHMTLSRFLRDYLYIPLGGARQGGLIKTRNLLITMTLGGLWHGANWTFVAWGALHGVLLTINHLWRDHSHGFPGGFRKSFAFSSICWSLTFLGVVVGWVLFRSPDIDTAISILRGMAGANGVSLPAGILAKMPWVSSDWIQSAPTDFPYPAIGATLQTLAMTALIVFVLPNTQQALLGSQHPSFEANSNAVVDTQFQRIPAAVRAGIAAVVALAAISQISELSPFLYFQF